VRWCFEDCPAFFRVLHAVKYEGQWPLLHALIRDFVPWAQHICGRVEEVVWVGIPDDPRRRRARGGSVVEALLDALSALDGTRRGDRLLVRRRNAPPQARIDDPARRAENVRTLFGVGDLVRVPPSARLVLVDDQITTGATAREAAFRLRSRGHPVRVLALAGARRAPEWLDP
jgi:predicted amidophosphoribosyltransferase